MDHTTQHWVTLFNDQAQELLGGVSAGDMEKLRQLVRISAWVVWGLCNGSPKHAVGGGSACPGVFPLMLPKQCCQCLRRSARLMCELCLRCVQQEDGTDQGRYDATFQRALWRDGIFRIRVKVRQRSSQPTWKHAARSVKTLPKMSCRMPPPTTRHLLTPITGFD